MGRSSQDQAIKNRSKVVQTANKLFRRYGVDNVSVADVMKANGMTVGGFYKQFESKDALIAEVLDLAFSESFDTWRKVGSEDKDGSTRTSDIVDYYLGKRAPEKRCPMISFAPHLASENASTESFEAYKAGTEGLFRQFIGQADDGGAAPTTAEAIDDHAMVTFAAMIGTRLLRQGLGKTELMDAMEKAVRDYSATVIA
ncbi:TetR/AcrR family transcriptional regulator [Dyella humicola]|uniref:TetR/AcrR family transcriptional regulator n=1 Tax=Dyella humicola TaxID=2992126 RepID=UPI00225BF95C|nr:TetR/AcrR family transcriptional regulator [Dyella humicola]